MVTTSGVGAEDGRRRTAEAFVKDAEKEMDEWVDNIRNAAFGLTGVKGREYMLISPPMQQFHFG